MKTEDCVKGTVDTKVQGYVSLILVEEDHNAAYTLTHALSVLLCFQSVSWHFCMRWLSRSRSSASTLGTAPSQLAPLTVIAEYPASFKNRRHWLPTCECYVKVQTRIRIVRMAEEIECS